jgi:hypothetical protein
MNEVLTDADLEGVNLYLDVQPAIDGDTALRTDQLVDFYMRCGFRPSKLGFPTMFRPPHPPEECYGQALSYLTLQRRNQRSSDLRVQVPYSQGLDPTVLFGGDPEP